MGADNKRLSADGDYDIVILGAGVAGLLLASELSRTARVLVLERNERAATTKYWITTEPALVSNPHLADAADLAFPSMDFIAFDGTTYRCEGDYRLWNTAAVIHSLLQCTIDQGGRVEFGQTFYSYARGRDRLTLMVNDGRVAARLVIDCMGHQSPVIAAEGCGETLGYYLLYGATFPLVGNIFPVALHNMSLAAHAAYVEAFPTRDGHLHIVLILPEKQFRPTSDLKAEFEFVIRKSPYRRFIAETTDRAFLGGIIPVVRMRRRALDRLFFYGEAGQVHPAATGTALTRMLLNHRAVAAFLLGCLDDDRLAIQPGRPLSTLPIGPIASSSWCERAKSPKACPDISCVASKRIPRSRCERSVRLSPSRVTITWSACIAATARRARRALNPFAICS